MILTEKHWKPGTCKRCGEVSSMYHHAKYCRDCAPIVRKEYIEARADEYKMDDLDVVKKLLWLYAWAIHYDHRAG